MNNRYWDPKFDADLERLVHIALSEDGEDITGNAIASPEQQVEAVVRSQAQGVLAGVRVAQEVFSQVSADLHVQTLLQDGDKLTTGSEIFRLRGSARAILKAERPALNFLQHLSGIATETQKFVNQISPHRAVLLDTRKTVPGLRSLAKYAVRCGGGTNHRLNLAAAILIKNNHIRVAGSAARAIQRARMAAPQGFVEIEVGTPDELAEVLSQGGVDRIMLDNFSVEAVRAAVAKVAEAVPLEVSGGINLDNIAAYAATGVSFISVGATTPQ